MCCPPDPPSQRLRGGSNRSPPIQPGSCRSGDHRRRGTVDDEDAAEDAAEEEEQEEEEEEEEEIETTVSEEEGEFQKQDEEQPAEEQPEPASDDNADVEPQQDPEPVPQHVPRCTKAGSYRAKQCSGKRKHKECWCVTHDGTEIEGSRWGKRGHNPTCRKVRAAVEKAAAEAAAAAAEAEAEAEAEVEAEVEEELLEVVVDEQMEKIMPQGHPSNMSPAVSMVAFLFAGVTLFAVFVTRRRSWSSSPLASQDATQAVVV